MLRRVLAVLAGVLVVWALSATSAFAVLSYPFDGELAPAGGSFGFLQSSAAVDDENGHTYVADQQAGVVDVFETATRTQLAGSLVGSATPAGSFGGVLAVAANNGTGRVYVLDPGHGVVDVFEASGVYACQITGKAAPSASECNGAAGSATPAGGLHEPGGIAVDQATGDVYVTDANDGVVDVFSAGGAYLRQILFSVVPGGGTGGGNIAVSDFNGHVYVANPNRQVVYEFDATGGYVATWTGANTPAGSFGRAEGLLSIAVDNTNGYVYVTGYGYERPTYVFESLGGYLGQFSHNYQATYGTAVDQATRELYISDNVNSEKGNFSTVKIFGPSVIIPGVTTSGASGVSPTGATLNGTVNPAGVQLSDCRFEYGTDTFYGQSAPCVPAAGSIPADSSDHAVSATLTTLQPGTTYHFRLRASNNGCASCVNYGEDAIVATPPQPLIDGASAVNVTGSSADLQASIDPRGFDTTYRFEWGTSTAYGTSVPVPDADIGAGTSDVAVSTHLSGLSTDTTYHWRVVAQNVNGVAVGGDHTFVYSTGGVGLPDGRAYEMVTPVHKDAALIGDVFAGVPPDISDDGSRIVVPTVQCFGAAVSCTADGNQVGTPYLFSRGGGGWTSVVLTPPASQSGGSDGILAGVDAGTALSVGSTPPFGEEDWYGRRADGSFVDIGPTSPPSAVTRGSALYFTASTDVLGTADLSHVVYEGSPVWPFDATVSSAVALYEYVGSGNSAPVLVGVSGGAGSTDLISECGTGLGDAEGGLAGDYGALSADGNTVFFTVSPCASGSGVNAGVAVPTTELFARIDGSRTVPISVRSPLECGSASGCASSPPRLAHFKGASNDGSRVFFLDTQQLTDSASEDSSSGDTAYAEQCAKTAGVNGCNLYEYDFGAPAGRNLIAVSAGDSSGGGPRVQGVMGISTDGSHVYFIARGVLTGVANAEGEVARDGAENLYVYERDASYPAGRVSFIASLRESDNEIDNTTMWTGDALHANVTPDGRFLVFQSRAALTADASDTDGAQVYRYDAVTGQLIRISIGEDGFNDNGNGGFGDAHIAAPVIARLGSPRSDPTMSDDGSFVFFESPVGLTPGALDDVRIGTEIFTGEPAYAENVYEWHEGHVYLLSDGRDVSASVSEECQHASSVCLLGSDTTGSNVFFMTADPLVASDTDTEVDIYDARICTGASPCIASSAAPVACQGEACHGNAQAPPAAVGAATATFGGPGNLAPPPAVVKSAAKKRKPAKKHARSVHGKPKTKKKRAGARARARHAVSSSGRPGHTSRAGGK